MFTHITLKRGANSLFAWQNQLTRRTNPDLADMVSRFGTPKLKTIWGKKFFSETPPWKKISK